MSFGENVTYFRKKLKITQEELAERLYVTRQTVSRWETDSAFPDVEMLIKLCDLFGCDMDTLVRKDAKAVGGSEITAPAKCEEIDNLAFYDKHMNRFALTIALGVGLIIFGVSLLLLISAYPGGEIWGTAVLLCCIAISVAGFIIAGINHENFMKEYPCLSPYPEEKVKKFSKKMPIMIAGATFLIFVGVILLIVMVGLNENYAPQGYTVEWWEHFSISIFMLLIAISVFTYVYAGILDSKYKVKQYNESCIKEGYVEGLEPKQKNKRERIIETLSSVIMMCATGAFLLLGFLGNLWHPAWVVFPVGGIACGIVSVIIEAIYKNKD